VIKEENTISEPFIFPCKCGSYFGTWLLLEFRLKAKLYLKKQLFHFTLTDRWICLVQGHYVELLNCISCGHKSNCCS